MKYPKGLNMKMRNIFISLLVIISSGFCYAATVQDLVSGYKPNATTPTTIQLTAEVPMWEADISTHQNFIDDVHCILGYDYYLGGQGFADIMWKDTDVPPDDVLGPPAEAPFVICGSMADGSTGYIVYKFKLPAGYITKAGSIIDANIVFRGDRTSYNDKTWLGVGPTFIPHTSVSFIEPESLGSFTKSFMTGGTAGEWATFTQQMSLAIPAGYNEFYVLITKDWGGQNRFGFHALKVTAVMESGTPQLPDVPEYDQFVPGYYPNSVSPKAIELNANNPVWDANLKTVPNFAADVHCIMGYKGTHEFADLVYRKQDGGWFGVVHEPYISCDKTADGGKIGSFVYKFVVPDGKVTGTGGTITMGCFLRGTPSNLNWVGISPTFAPNSSGNFTEIENTGDFTKTYMPGSTWGVYEQNLTLNIPAGLSTFYVAVVSDWGTSNYFGVYSMHVAANLTEGVMPVMMYYMPDNRLLKYELDRMATNDIGMSGAVFGGWNLGDDVNAMGGINTPAVKNICKEIADAGKNVTPAMRHFAAKLYMGYVTSNWPANTWAAGAAWNKALSTIRVTAEDCNYAGIKHIILDWERYAVLDTTPLTGTYFIQQTTSSALTDAYQRGVEAAQIISAKAPNVDVLLMPEYGSGYQGSTSSYPACLRFINGLLNGSSTLRVYVGVEGTFCNFGESSNMLYGIAGSVYTDPAAYKTATINYLNTINTNIRNRIDNQALWNSRGGLVPGFWVVGTANSREGKRSAWLTPEMFAAQLDAFKTYGAQLVFEYAPIFAWKQWFGNEVAAAGMYPFDGYANPDNNNNWVAELATHPYIEAYKAVLSARGMPANGYDIPQQGDINGDSYVDFDDVKVMGLNWLNSN